MNLFNWFRTKAIVGLFCVPLEAIKSNPFHFITWFVAVPVIGLMGFWLPILLVWSYSGDVKTVFEHLLYAGTTASVCVAILGEGVYAMMIANATGLNKTTSGIRGLIVCWSIVIVILLVGTAVTDVALSSGQHVRIVFHITFTCLAILTACYLYCFRYRIKVKSVDEEIADQDAEILTMCKKGLEQTADGDNKL
jgi:hypothetical protein